MIRYSLRCTHDHQFDEWFSNSGEYDSRKESGDLTCPECGDTDVVKAIMAPNVAKAQAPAPSCSPQACGGCPFSGQH
jgi:hypothetical protein